MMQENFVWEKDKASITCTAPGLYEVTFGFFTRRKPAVQLLINGEPVLSAVSGSPARAWALSAPPLSSANVR